MSLSAEQITDFRGDLGIGTGEVFSDLELNRLFTRADENYSLAVLYGYRQIMASAAKLHDYRMAMTEEKRSQVWDHLKEMVAIWTDEARGSGNQLKSVGLLGVPPRTKDRPWRNRRSDGSDDMAWLRNIGGNFG